MPLPGAPMAPHNASHIVEAGRPIRSGTQRAAFTAWLAAILLAWMLADGMLVYCKVATTGDQPVPGGIAPAFQPLRVQSSNPDVSILFTPSLGAFSIQGPGARAFQQCSVRFRCSGKLYSFPAGLSVSQVTRKLGQDVLGSFQKILVTWKANNAAHTRLETGVSIYAGRPLVKFELRFPDGATDLAGGDFGDIGTAFPVFAPPSKPPAGLRWFSYSYQDWPIPIRGNGWPSALADSQWPAGGSDDGIRTPLVEFTRIGDTDVLTPIDHPLQQIVGLALSVRPVAYGNYSASAYGPGGNPGSGSYPGAGYSADYGSGASSGAGSSGYPSGPGSLPVGPPGVDPASPGNGDDSTSSPAYAPSSGMPDSAGYTDSTSDTSTVTGAGLPVEVGPEGMLKSVPRGAAFHSMLIFGHAGVSGAVLQWGRLLRLCNGKARRPAPDDLSDHYLGYWTDAGSTYYYSTEGNSTYATTLRALADYHRNSHIPVRYYQLDSWWYQKGSDSGTTIWRARKDTLPAGVEQLSRDLRVPLALHNRYWSQSTPNLKSGGFLVGEGASVPQDKSFYEDLFHRAKRWDCCLYEQDWLATQIQRVLALQQRYETPERWINALDSAAGDTGLPVQFCMPSMGFYLASSGLPNVTQIRTSEDFSRADQDATLRRWMEDLQLSLPAEALGLAPFRDVFITSASGSSYAGSTEVTEALLGALSDGPVGIGDPFGKTDMSVVGKLALEDGTLVQPDVPATPIEPCLTGEADARGLPLVASSYTSLGGQTWQYALALDLGDTRSMGIYHYSYLASDQPARPATMPTTTLLDLGLPDQYLCYDPIADSVVGIARPGKPVALSTPTGGAGYYVLAPIEPDGSAFLGDVSKYVPVSGARFADIQASPGRFILKLKGPAGSAVRLAFYSPQGKPAMKLDGHDVPAEPHSDYGYSPYSAGYGSQGYGASGSSYGGDNGSGVNEPGGNSGHGADSATGFGSSDDPDNLPADPDPGAPAQAAPAGAVASSPTAPSSDSGGSPAGAPTGLSPDDVAAPLPVANGGAFASGDSGTSLSSSLWYFSFNLPDSVRRGPVAVTVTVPAVADHGLEARS